MWLTPKGVLTHLLSSTAAVVILLAVVQRPASALPLADQVASSNVEARGWLSRGRVREGEEVQLWIEVRNRGDSTVKGLDLVKLSHPGLCLPNGESDTGACTQEGLPLLEVATNKRVSALTLAPGLSAVLLGNLEGGNDTGKFVASAVMSWRTDDGTSHTISLSFPEIEVRGHWALDGGLFGLLKDLALPIVVLFLGVLFRLTEQRRAAVQEIWAQMLPTSHEAMQKHYLPVTSQFMRIEADLKALDKPAVPSPNPGKQPSQVERLYFLWIDNLILLRKMKKLVNESGGFHFKRRSGEQLAGYSWALFRVGAEEILGRAPLDRLISQLDPDAETAAEIQAQLDQARNSTRSDLQQLTSDANHVWSQFRDWHRGGYRDLYVPILRLFSHVLDFEMNYPFEPWYKQREALPYGELARIKEDIQSWRSRNADAELKKALGTLLDYLQCWRGS